MYPLKLIAPIKDYLWGGTRLKTDFGFKTDKEIAAEAWLLSCHKDGSSVVENGEMAGKTLPEVLDIWGKEALGSRAADFTYFPLLIKFIDAKQSLSVQVHPDDEYAMRVEGEYGKTEMWYVVDCDEGAELIYGFKDKISSEEFARRIKDNTLMEVCNSVPVHKGDVFFITAGTLHAIGKGILIAEVQQNSNSTYRVYDFGRVGADGKPRELHIDKAVDVTICDKPQHPYGQIGKVVKEETNAKLTQLSKCDLFQAYVLSLSGLTNINTNESFVSLVCLDGEFDLQWDDNIINAKKGDSIFIPAHLNNVNVKGNAEILCSYI